MAKINRTPVSIQFPDPPKISDRPERQDEFAAWHDSLCTGIRNQFEEMANTIDELRATIDELRSKT